MVTIGKNTQRQNAIVSKKTIVALIFLLTVGGIYHWFSLLLSLLSDQQIQQPGIATTNTIIDATNHELRSQQKQSQLQTPKQMQQSQHQYATLQQQLQSISEQLSFLGSQIISTNLPTNMNDKMSKFQSTIHKECIPGRDDVKGELNPTTHKNRECLRYVPLGKQPGHMADNNLEELKKNQKPRIGIMAPPGYISEAFSLLVKKSLEAGRGSKSSSNSNNNNSNSIDIDIIPTSHVPVYGYGKSHGYTKLIRFITLPLPLAVWDAYLYTSLHAGGALPSVTPTSIPPLPTPETAGIILQLLLRWHCRLSHVSAHTSMMTLSLEDIMNDAENVLEKIIGFVWRDDWEWEGGGGKGGGGRKGDHANNDNNMRGEQDKTQEWKALAKTLLALDSNAPVTDGGQLDNIQNGSFGDFLHQTSRILHEVSSALSSNNKFEESLQNAFLDEMKLSKDMTKWPCPSFWEGVDVTFNSQLNEEEVGEGGFNQMRVVEQLASQLVPDCKDSDPFVRCTVNRDRCEVKRDSKCK